MNQGIIYYNMGDRCVVRLLVSIYTLKQHYKGDITIISEGETSHKICKQIAEATGVNFRAAEFDVPEGPNYPYLVKTRIHEATPYDLTLFLDSDTVIIGPLDELFDDIAEYSFIAGKMGRWITSKGKVSGRIKSWAQYHPELIEDALNYGPAVNTGTFGFTLDSSLMKEWYPRTLVGRSEWIPDEVVCQLLLPQHKHRIVNSRYNRSCKYDDPTLPDTRVIHYHGRKHCREGLPFHADKWVAVYNEVVSQNLADVKSWQPGTDRMLRYHIKRQQAHAQV